MLLTKLDKMKNEIQIREQIEKLKKAISKDEEFLRNATGNERV